MTVSPTARYQWQESKHGGRILLSFSNALDAVHFCCHIQQQLLSLEWSEALLGTPPCAEVRGDGGGVVLHRGLPVAMGVTFTDRLEQLDKHPADGRVDYMIPEVNLAARLASAATSGQVAVDGAGLASMFETAVASGSGWAVQRLAADGSLKAVASVPATAEGEGYQIATSLKGDGPNAPPIILIKALGSYKFEGTGVVTVASACPAEVPRDFIGLGQKAKWVPNKHMGRMRSSTSFS